MFKILTRINITVQERFVVTYKYQFSIFFIAIFIVLFTSCNENTRNDFSSTELFEKLSSDKTNIKFSNALKPNVSNKFNLLDYDYYYNGAGVGIEDINNDGLLDVFFCGNEKPNKLYLNKGDFIFEDISDAAGINVNKYWSTGVTFVDINQDGFMDIYVSQGGPHPDAKRKNLLFINQKNLQFIERAMDYGLADEGMSTQSVFFDYDNDNDLDCFVMNESIAYGYDPITFFRLMNEESNRFYTSYSHLYENQNQKFVDVSIKAGIDKPTFGLGLSVSDINSDGLLDIYVANDYYVPDYMYINKGNGTFSDRAKLHLSQMSFFGMGSDIADIDNDSDKDIFVLDMASADHKRSKTLMASMDTKSFDLLTNGFRFPYQYMFNSLQLNDGNNRFQNIAQMSGLSKTDWSWSVLINDFDLNYNKDIYITNGYRKYGLDNDFKNMVIEAKTKYKNKVPLDIKRELYEKMPSEKLANIFFNNDGQLQFSNRTKELGLDYESFSNGAAYGDLDNDGDADLVVNNIDEEAFVFKNKTLESSDKKFVKLIFDDASKKRNILAKLYTSDRQVQYQELTTVRGYMSSIAPELIFGIRNNATIDSLVLIDGTEKKLILNKVNQNAVIEVNYDQFVSKFVKSDKLKTKSFFPIAPMALNLDFKHQENEFDDFEKETLLPQKQSTQGPSLSIGDLNQDGQEDIVIGGAKDQATQVYLSNEGSFRKVANPVLIADRQYEDVSTAVFDVDLDGDLDLFVAGGGNWSPNAGEAYADRLYINNGSGVFTAGQVSIESHNYNIAGDIAVIDLNNDGYLDIIVGNRIRPQSYPLAAQSYILINDKGNLKASSEEWISGFNKLGIINDIEIVDWNNDGLNDIVMVGEWDGIHIFENQDGSFKNISKELGLDQLKGWWYSVHQLDMNNDGYKDLIIGNVGLNTKHKASLAKPFSIYAKDFDNNNSLDIVLSYKYKDEDVIARGKECSSGQMPFISEKYETYQEFADASLQDIFGAENLNESYKKEANEFRSVLLKHSKNNSYDLTYLPKEAQMFPILDAIIYDFNEDGNEDILVGGCIYNAEVETPRLDMGHGLLLYSDGTSFVPSKSTEDYLYIPGNLKKLELLQFQGKAHIVGAVNNGAPAVLQFNGSQ